MSAPAAQPEARSALLRFYHTAEWLVVAAVIVAAALVVDPAQRDNANLHIAATVYLVTVLSLARLHWPVRDESARLFAGTFLLLLGVAGMLSLEAPTLNGLLITFVLPTTTAWLVLSRSRAVWIMLLAFALTAGVTLSGQPTAFDLVYAGTLCGCFFLTARVAEIALRAATRVVAQAAALSRRDELTRLPSRYAFLRNAEIIHAKALESRIPYAVEIVDINNLRTINDTYGYAAGDRAVVLVAEALQRLRAPDEHLARYDGDKFVLLIPKLEGDRAEDLARRIRAVVFSTTFDANMEVVRIKANVGVARYPLAGVTLDALISAAERDMKLDQQGRERPSRKPVFRRRSGKLSA